MIKDENSMGELAYVPSRYSKAYNLYSKNQIKLVMPFLTSIAQTCHYGAQFPICKVLKAISKFFLLNEIQVIFLAYVIRETNWDIKDRIISSNSENIQDIVCYAIESLEYKRIILYLMVASFTVKYYLNQDTSEAMEQASKRCPNFKYIFEIWAKKHSSITTKINPRTLNSVYKHLYSDLRKQKRDFNLMVDCILQISPAYNPEKDKGGKKQERRKSEIKTQKGVRGGNTYLKHEKNGFISIGTNDKLLNLIQIPPSDIHPENTVLNPFMPFKGDRVRSEHIQTLRNSIIGEKNQIYKNLEGNIAESQSEQNNQRAKIMQEPNLGLNRGISITQKYLSSDFKANENNSQKANQNNDD